MQVVGIVLLVLLGCFVAYLLVDTVVYIVRRVKEKKKQKEHVQKDDDVINN